MKTARRALIASGALIIAYAVSGALADSDFKFGTLAFLAAVIVAHDGLLMPLTIGAGALIGRIVPPTSRTPVRVAAVLSLALTIVAFPLVLGSGRVADNPSVLPLHYGRGLFVVYTLIWVTTTVVVVARRRRHRPHRGEGN
ncbi:hypothetical protein DMB66_34875 [Actinoplanes sp. ATCC 53533]|uniref:hypothetical protein n=1 Tax=Actinoplanes sp. ATCC 53533 TaxID=1288362 RepID=UPI000F788760|nr:hypothetical protein [Actinoplanes sp. ATCC 53533]RSM55782.1 hypothetical protein DMB66_34875 [Actinoplanes sp. ATCC 53533]